MTALHNISGKAAEDEVVQYLKKHGFKILDQNWKTKWCEVDIVALKDQTMHFVEVKYRNSSGQGGGFDYITSKKLQKMNLAAKSWVEINGWSGEYTLSAAEVSGDNFEIFFLEDVSG
ncbi:MAG TPA: YraN family protein [Candidatus Saccharimonadales bacterium]|nr:YraN family protein [Candidatus Saccharimonadales bacterium]